MTDIKYNFCNGIYSREKLPHMSTKALVPFKIEHKFTAHGFHANVPVTLLQILYTQSSAAAINFSIEAWRNTQQQIQESITLVPLVHRFLISVPVPRTPVLSRKVGRACFQNLNLPCVLSSFSRGLNFSFF